MHLFSPIFSPIENPLERGFKDISNSSVLFIAHLVEEWIRARESMVRWRWMMETLSVEASELTAGIFHNIGRWLISNIFVFVYECLDFARSSLYGWLDRTFIDPTISRVIKLLLVKSIFKVSSIEIPFQGNFWPLKKKKKENRWIILFVHLIYKFSL